jgi:hypothetical protein
LHNTVLISSSGVRNIDCTIRAGLEGLMSKFYSIVSVASIPLIISICSSLLDGFTLGNVFGMIASFFAQIFAAYKAWPDDFNVDLVKVFEDALK